MKRYNFFVHIVANCVIVAILVGVYFCCVPLPITQAVTAPIYQGDSNENKVAIMINVYQGSEYIEPILDTLKFYNATCTFFVGGSWVAKNTELLKKMDAVAEIGNHGYLHKDHKYLSFEKNIEEMTLCHQQVKAVTNKDMTLFAPPSGSYGDNTIKAVDECSYSLIMWSKDTIDWRDEDYKLVYNRATNKIKNGDMILMHPTAHTLKALPSILDYYNQKGKKAVTVTELLSTTRRA